MLLDKCINCGRTDNLSYHHVVPLSKGGNDIPSNIVPLCPECHALAHGFTHGKTIADEDCRLKMSIAKQGRNHPSARPIKCITTGKMYDTVEQATQDLKYSSSSVITKAMKRNCRTRYYDDSGALQYLFWEYIKEKED